MVLGLLNNFENEFNCSLSISLEVIPRLFFTPLLLMLLLQKRRTLRRTLLQQQQERNKVTNGTTDSSGSPAPQPRLPSVQGSFSPAPGRSPSGYQPVATNIKASEKGMVWRNLMSTAQKPKSLGVRRSIVISALTGVRIRVPSSYKAFTSSLCKCSYYWLRVPSSFLAGTQWLHPWEYGVGLQLDVDIKREILCA